MRYIATLAVVFSLLFALPARAAVTAQEVETAINKAKEFLYKSQRPDGTWETAPPPANMQAGGSASDVSQWGGKTAMAVYALLVCGERATEPKLQKAIAFLHQNNTIVGTYALAMKCQVWLNLPPTPEVKKSMRRDALLLLTSRKGLATNPQFVVWDYYPSPRKEYSFSRSQYAALGLWAAQEMDIEVPTDIWRAIEKTWESAQKSDGGWAYKFEKDVGGDLELTTMCMTAAGLATLYIAQDFTKAESNAAARGNASSMSVDRAMKWVTANFKDRVATDKSMPREFPHAMLYALERVGLAGGVRRFGTADWYDVGATWLVKKQSPGGSIGSGTFGSLVDTSWAMLFLQRGRTPVAFNKLDYTLGSTDAKKAEWNQRPRDIANITRWLSKSGERELRWQVVGIDDTVAAMLESPVLYLSGEAPLNLNADAKAKLKAYAESGGLILVNADTGNTNFARSAEKLGAELFAGSEWRDLPDDHPIWAGQNFKRDTFKSKMPIRGISNGVRELMLVVPTADLAKAWQLRNPKRQEDHFKMGANILSYAVNINNFYSRGESWLAAEPPATAKTTGTVTVGRLQYNGKWDPEPQAWVQMTKFAKAKGLDVKTVVLKAGEPITGVNIVHVTGTTNLKLDDATRTALKDFSAKGGIVLFEAAGGSGEFATAAQGEIIAIYGGDKLKTLPGSHAIYGKDLPPVSYRTYNIDAIANPVAPQLGGVEEGGKVVALLSKEDLTAGMLGVPTDGIMGYRADSARNVMLRVLMSVKK